MLTMEPRARLSCGIAACDRNTTSICMGRPIVTCDSTEDIVFYVKQADVNKVEYRGNCILIEGNGLDLVKSTDKVLYNLYGLMDQ